MGWVIIYLLELVGQFWYKTNPRPSSKNYFHHVLPLHPPQRSLRSSTLYTFLMTV